ncbi:MAG: restriction endonuclease [Ferruginibacter sp.]
MEDNESMQSIFENKPIKPTLEEFNLTNTGLAELESFKQICKKKKEIIFFLIFILFSAIGAISIHTFDINWLWLLPIVVSSAILTLGIIDRIIKAITKFILKDLLFEKLKSQSIDILNKNKLKYEIAKADYLERNEFFERVVRRSTWHYWQSLSALDFEDAVAGMFEDKGWKVRKTPYKGDQGVDIFIEKDGTKGIVQCKTYKKVLGPNSVRDLYGTMVSHNATVAYLTAPGGFSQTTKDFCRGKPITLLDIDGLTEMFYDFENYRPFWLDNAKSLNDIQNCFNKLFGRTKRRY